MQADPGPIGGDLSHEFIILAETGESAVFCDRALLDVPVPGRDFDFEDHAALEAEMEKRTQYYAATEEKHDEAAFAAIPDERKIAARGIEVGHIFYFGTKYSKPMKAEIQTADGQLTEIHGGSYGIGVSRLVGGIIEASHDEKGIVWPASVSPFDIGLLNLRASDAECTAACDEAYQRLENAGFDVLYDDRDERPGGKFATMDLIGLPWQLAIGPRGLKAGTVELKDRASGETEELSLDAALHKLTGARA
jgi:prolyl-tRNA synthetase